MRRLTVAILTLVATVAMLSGPGPVQAARRTSPGTTLGPSSDTRRLGQTGPARARVLILWIDGTTLADWSRPDLRNFSRLLRDGSVATLSTWTGSTVASMPSMRARAAATFAATPPAPGEEPALSARQDEQTFAGLGALIASTGRSWSVIGGAERDATRGVVRTALGGAAGGQDRSAAAPAPIRGDRSFPTGARTDVAAAAALARARLADTDLMIVDFADVARVESRLGANPALRAPWIALSMRRADQLLGELLRAVRPIDTVMVLSPTPPVLRQVEGLRLGAVAVTRSSYRGRTLLTSDTTRRPGFVSLIDMAPTVLSLLRLPPEDGFLSGRPMRAAQAPGHPGAAARAVEGDLIEAARIHKPVTRAVLGWAILWGALALLTVLAGRGRPAGSGALPAGWRDWLSTLSMQAMIAPVIAGVFTVFGSKGSTGSVVFTFVVSFLAATGARAVLGRRRACIAALAAAFAVPLLDVLTGSSLSTRSALVSPLAEGRNLDGIDAGAVGIVFAGGIFGLGLVLDRVSVPHLTAWRAIAWWAAPPVLVLGTAVAVLGGMSFPRLALAAIPAAGLLAARAAGRHVSARALLAAACAIVFVFAVLSLDYEREGGDPISVIVTGGLSPVARAHAEAAKRLFGGGAWPFALVLLVAPLTALWWRRRSLLDRALWGRTHHRAALSGAAATAAVSLLAVEGGLVTAVYLTLYASMTTLLFLLTPDD